MGGTGGTIGGTTGGTTTGGTTGGTGGTGTGPGPLLGPAKKRGGGISMEICKNNDTNKHANGEGKTVEQNMTN